MSFSDDGRLIVCDGPGCASRAGAPVALRTVLSKPDDSPDSIRGWLFVGGRMHWRHYCQKCVPQYFRGIPQADDGERQEDLRKAHHTVR